MTTKILLDTHVWLWMNGEPERLSHEAKNLLTAPDSTLFLSSASVWEVAIKVQSGKLVLPQSAERYVVARMAENQITALPINIGHALRAAGLPLHHRDPFDRMLVAQAQTEGIRLMTADRQLNFYEIDIIGA